MLRKRWIALVFAGALSAGLLHAETQLPPPPQVNAVDQVDDYFGTKVKDPYRWLEDESLPETQAFIKAQNARTRLFLDSPQRDQLEKRLTELTNYPRETTPSRRGRFAFYSTNSGLQNQNVMHVTEKIGDAGRVLIDPNKLSEDGTVSIGQASYTKDGTLMAYGLAKSGSDHSEIRVKDVVTGKDLDDVIPPARQGASNGSATRAASTTASTPGRPSTAETSRRTTTSCTSTNSAPARPTTSSSTSGRKIRSFPSASTSPRTASTKR
jgi:protease II